LALHFHHSLLALLVERVLSCSFIWIHLTFMVLLWCETAPYFCQCPSSLNLAMYQTWLKF
jgi:hypothetical protein